MSNEFEPSEFASSMFNAHFISTQKPYSVLSAREDFAKSCSANRASSFSTISSVISPSLTFSKPSASRAASSPVPRVFNGQSNTRGKIVVAHRGRYKRGEVYRRLHE